MGSAAGKLGVAVSHPIQSPDVMYDLKEVVHRTPHVRSSAVPSPARLNVSLERDLLQLDNGTVVRLQVYCPATGVVVLLFRTMVLTGCLFQTKQKDGTRGINLYKRSLKSLPRDLFNHPLAEEVTWLNLASNSFIYHRNGIFKNIDTVGDGNNGDK